MNRKTVKLIESRETTVQLESKNCLECIYRDREIGHCWYTMTTNKANNISANKCDHFVDKNIILKDLEDK